jgi:hypothetical protein
LISPEVIVPDPTFRDAPVIAPVTPRVPPTVALFVTAAEFRVARPDVDTVDRVVLPVTPRVPPTVALLVTPKEFRVEAPEELSVVNAPVLGVVAPIVVPFIVPPVIATPLEAKLFAVRRPVTPRVPPTVALFVTAAEFRVARPEVDTVDSDVLPVTPRVPPIVALFVTASVPNVAVPVPVIVVASIVVPNTVANLLPEEPRFLVPVASGPISPATSSLNVVGVVVPIPTLPAFVMRKYSVPVPPEPPPIAKSLESAPLEILNKFQTWALLERLISLTPATELATTDVLYTALTAPPAVEVPQIAELKTVSS